MTRARGGRAALAVAAAICLTVLGATPVTAEPGRSPEGGYWWQPEPVTGLIPVPGVPANGLYVASATSGPQAESAVRFAVSDLSADVQLTLHVSKQEEVGQPSVAGYPATDSWSTGGPQPWSARPSYRSHATPAKGILHTSGSNPTMTITFPAFEAVKGIVLVPAGADAGGQSPTFSVAFAPPRARDVAIVRRGSPTSASPTLNPPTSSHPPPSSVGSASSASRPSPLHHHPKRTPRGGRVPPSSRTSASPPVASPAGSPSSETAIGSRDPDNGTKDIIIVAGVVVAGLLILTGWRAARRG